MTFSREDRQQARSRKRYAVHLISIPEKSRESASPLDSRALDGGAPFKWWAEPFDSGVLLRERQFLFCVFGKEKIPGCQQLRGF
ncbi:hypothetical protein SAMN02745702_00741 [Desulfobaculum bizertense DSM 18034]|uniref:Uncharacterized protein n=1 Tax=Desulfobaculum bizertense DSM 18034 TaxID=1121442 RepID=A0A1T4VQ10_9BACT|nr:hypothetical protein SAMN02745702_00741 [Desulfobaculum bizertense DSM 18034]